VYYRFFALESCRRGTTASNDAVDHGPGGNDGQHAAWELCPVGTALAAVALTGDHVVHLDSIRAPLPEAEPVILVAAPVTRNYWARAPPLIRPS
jgi:hypothetical protein